MSMLKDKMQIKNKTYPKTINIGKPSIYKKNDQWYSIKTNELVQIEELNFQDWKNSQKKEINNVKLYNKFS